MSEPPPHLQIKNLGKRRRLLTQTLKAFPETRNVLPAYIAIDEFVVSIILQALISVYIAVEEDEHVEL